MMKSALIVYGGWDGHSPKEGSELFAGLLRKDGYTVELSTSLDTLTDAEALNKFDLIIPNWTMGQISGDQVKGLSKAIASGVGLAGFHGGAGDAFRANCDFQFIVGGQFVGHPGNIRKYTVNIVDHVHPVTEGIADFEMESEFYYMHVDPIIHVLAQGTWDGDPCPWLEGVVMPVMWTKPYGQGRVFYSALGHQISDFDVAECRETILRGMKWATRSD